MIKTVSNVVKKDILVVDDFPENLQYLSQVLSENDYKVRAVLSGAQALAAAKASPPDLILLDILMPDINGYEVCDQMKADPRTADIPIIFLSALDDLEDKVRAFTSGGVDYITKPFHAQEVLARVGTHLKLRAVQEDLIDQIEMRNELIAELDAFAHTVAHDLKNPLANILGFSNIAASMWCSGESENIDECLDAISTEAVRINRIINALLTLASVRNDSHFQKTTLDMATIVRETLHRLRNMTLGAEIILPEEWPQALGYDQWIEEVWANYLSNAIKYGGESPRIELGSDILPDGMLRFWVKDNGAGLTPDEQTSLFIPFTRLSQSKIEGNGLGLSIVQRIIERLGGEVGLESEKGLGSTFYFSLPPAH